MNPGKREDYLMEQSALLKNLREKHQLTQEEFASKLLVSRQAVSRWENGETQPGVETLKIISREFNMSINTLLGSPRQLVCQCCGMPLTEDDYISREPDGSFNESYCKWCYTDGKYMYKDKESLLDYLVANMPSLPGQSAEEKRVQYNAYLETLDHWKK